MKDWKSSRTVRDLWVAVESAIDEGMTIREFLSESAEAWEEATRERSDDDRATWDQALAL